MSRQKRTSVMVITVVETNRFGYEEHIVSHGVDVDTGKDIVMQQQPVKYYGNSIRFDAESNEFWLWDVEE